MASPTPSRTIREVLTTPLGRRCRHPRRRAVLAVAAAVAVAVVFGARTASLALPHPLRSTDDPGAAGAAHDPPAAAIPRECDDCPLPNPRRSVPVAPERREGSPARTRPAARTRGEAVRAAGGDAVASAVGATRSPARTAADDEPTTAKPPPSASASAERDTPRPAGAPRQQPAPEADEAVQAPPPAEPPARLAIRVVDVTATSPFSATVVWRTTLPARTRIEYGPADADPLVWTPSADAATEHETTVHGLSFASRYELRLLAEDEFDRTADVTVDVTTPPLLERTRATTADGVVLLDGEPFFPRMVWGQCSKDYGASLEVGINTFVGNDCEAAADQLARLAGRAFSVIPAAGSAQGKGVIGTYLPDELDAHLPSDLTASALDRLIGPNADGGVRLLTLSSHFYSNAEPLPQGRGLYPALIAKADVVGFDLYPLQNWCRSNAFTDVYDAQRELVATSGGKPTYQWIEVRDIDCHGDPSLSVTPETVWAEAWLSIAGGAHGIGYFPNEFAPPVATEIARLSADLDALAPALLEPATDLDLDGSPAGAVKASVRDHNGALYVIAINVTRQPATATIDVPGLGNRTLTPVGRGSPIAGTNDVFSETLEPLGVRVYVVEPEST